VTALVVGHDRDGDGRAIALGADQHASHRPFLGRGDLAVERGALREYGWSEKRKEREGQTGQGRGNVRGAHQKISRLDLTARANLSQDFVVVILPEPSPALQWRQAAYFASSTRVVVAGPSPEMTRIVSSSLAPSQCTCLPK